MGVKIGRLFKDARFNKLPTESKLLYIYLATNPDINTVGVFSPNIEVATIESGLDKDLFKRYLKVLISNKMVHVKKVGDIVYFIVPEHFNTQPKSEAMVNRVNKALKSLPTDIVKFLSTLGVNPSSKVKSFEKPTLEQVADYSLENGYLIDAKEFVDYYEGQAQRYGKNHWVDGRGTQVKDWKAKLRKVWFKDERKLKTFKDAPKGYEAFYVREGDKLFCPDGWKNGKPYSKDFITDMKLKKEYEKRRV